MACWQINAGQAPYPSTYGYDAIGLSETTVNDIRETLDSGGYNWSCPITIFQNMNLSCNGTAGPFAKYWDNIHNETLTHAQAIVGLCLVLVIAAIGWPLCAQMQGSAAGLPQAHIEHAAGHATLTAIDARPLDEGITAIRQEYGWLVDYEDPTYSEADLTPLGPGDWKSPFPHRPGLRRPAGEQFTTTYPEGPIGAMNNEQAMEQVLDQTLRDYAQSGNPGRFTLLHTAHGRYDLVGGNGSVTAVLDTPVSIAAKGESAFDFLTQMLEAVQAQTGHRVGLGLVPTNLLTQCSINQSFSHASARSIVLATIQVCSNDLVWQFLYDANQDTFLLNIDAAVIVYTDAAGVRKLGPRPHFQ